MFKAVTALLPPNTVTSYAPEPMMYLHSTCIALGLFILYFFIIKDIRLLSKRLFQIALLSLALKFLNAIYVQGLIFFGRMYEGGDSLYYDDMGRQMLPFIQENPMKFIFDYFVGMPISREGTMLSLTGLLYYLTGSPSLLAASVIGAFVSSVGAYLFFKSYRLGFPHSDYKLFGYLIFLFPSIVFWTSQHLEVYVGQSSLFEQMDLVKSYSVKGGSAIALKPIASLSQIGNLPYNLFSVLFRPLIFEARNGFIFLASLECTALLGLALASLKSAWPLGKKPPFWFFLVSYVLMFSIAFSFQVGNLGTMMRIKISVLPFLFMLFSYHLSPKQRGVVAQIWPTRQAVSGHAVSAGNRWR